MVGEVGVRGVPACPARAVKPRLLDLFCGAGGAARGYQRAGFHVVGVDLAEQPNYCGDDFYRRDALDVMESGWWASFDAIHASPPCQAYTQARHIHGRTDHPDLVAPTREALKKSRLPYVIENVPGAPLLDPVVLCGRAFGLNVKRHRLFESNVALLVPPCPKGHPGDWLTIFGSLTRSRQWNVPNPQPGKRKQDFVRKTLQEGLDAMGVDWPMTQAELSEAIPPIYTEHIGGQLMSYLKVAA